MFGVDAAETYGGAVGVVGVDAHRCTFYLLLQVSHSSHLRVYGLVFFGMVCPLFEQTSPIVPVFFTAFFVAPCGFVVGVAVAVRVNVAERRHEQLEVGVAACHDVSQRHQRVARILWVCRYKARRCLCLSQPAARSLTHQCVADVYNVVGSVATCVVALAVLLFGVGCQASDSLVEVNGFAAAVRQRFGENHKVFGKFADVERRTTEAVGSRLSDHDKRALRLEEFLLQSLYCGVGESNVAVEHTEAALFGQFGCVEREERFGYGHVDEYWSRLAESGSVHRFVHKTVAIPALLFVSRLGQRHAAAHKAIESVGLRQRLTVELVNPLLRSVGSYDDERHMLVVSLCHSRSRVEQSRTRRDAYHCRTLRAESHAHSVERRRALVGDRVAAYCTTFAEVMHDGSIATARTNHSVCHSPFDEQRCQYVYVFLVAIHFFYDCLTCDAYICLNSCRIVFILASVSSHSD